MLLALFPNVKAEYSQWMEQHLQSVASKFSSSRFVVVPEEAATRIPFVESTPCIVCFDGNEIGGVLDAPKSRSAACREVKSKSKSRYRTEESQDSNMDVDHFCRDIDRWLEMMHGSH